MIFHMYTRITKEVFTKIMQMQPQHVHKHNKKIFTISTQMQSDQGNIYIIYVNVLRPGPLAPYSHIYHMAGVITIPIS